MNFVMFLLGFCFVLLILAVAVIFFSWYHNQAVAREEWIEEEPESNAEKLNLKVPKEAQFITVMFGDKEIQLRPEEWLIWNTWSRERKRIFVRDFKKLETKGKIKK